MSLNNRYMPSHAVGDSCLYALDFSNILPLGVGFEGSVGFEVEYNTVPPTGQSDFTVGPPYFVGRRIYAQLSGGASAKDYRLTFTGGDSLGNTWSRSALLLCSATS